MKPPIVPARRVDYRDKLPTLTELIKDKVAYFTRYQDNTLWYRIVTEPGKKFEFPIPISDAGGGEFLPSDKAITFQRWIWKHLDYLKGSVESDRGEEDGS